MNSRRSFIKKTIGTVGAVTLTGTADSRSRDTYIQAIARLRSLPIAEAVQEQDLWRQVAQNFTTSPQSLYLNNAGVSPQPKTVQDAVERYNQYANEGPTLYMGQYLTKGKEPLRQKLAALAGASAEEIAINRNTTEALTTITFGLRLAAGDEIVMALQDYPAMIDAWQQRALRDGIKIISVNVDPLEEDAMKILKLYVEATTSKTKIWHITHMLNLNGQILPAKLLCAEARKRGIISIVDGAQTFAHLDYKISDINPDYYGASLHKWLCAPFGTGLLYVKKNNIADLWPLFPNSNPQSDDIRKFETLGTRSIATEQAINQAIDFHLLIGSKLKEERLRYLKNYWCEKVAVLPRVKMNVSLKPQSSCGVANFTIDGFNEPTEIVNILAREHHLLTVPTKLNNVTGVRISPNIFTLTDDLDRLVEAIKKIIT